MAIRRHAAAGTARDRAAAVLLRIQQAAAGTTPVTVQTLVHEALAGLDDPREAGLCSEIVYGALRWQLKLEWIMALYLRAPHKLPPTVRAVLLSASYEILFLSRVPAHATVNWAVSAARHTGGKSLGAVTNAVLRKIADLGVAAHTPEFYADRFPDPLCSLSVMSAVPLWIVRLWHEHYGYAEAARMALNAGRTPWPVLRLNAQYPDWESTRAQALELGGRPIAHSGIAFEQGAVPECAREWVAAGRASWHGAGSQELLHALGAADWEGPIWDACAGRGGKACALLELGRDVRLASDPHPRVAGVEGECRRLGLPAIPWRQAKAQDVVQDFVPRTIMLDVPCSGLGTLSRRPDVRLFRTPEQVRDLILVQSELVEMAWARLPRGGQLAYLTCTMHPGENEHQMERLATCHPEARILRQHTTSGDDGADVMYGALVQKS